MATVLESVRLKQGGYPPGKDSKELCQAFEHLGESLSVCQPRGILDGWEQPLRYSATCPSQDNPQVCSTYELRSCGADRKCTSNRHPLGVALDDLAFASGRQENWPEEVSLPCSPDLSISAQCRTITEGVALDLEIEVKRTADCRPQATGLLTILGTQCESKDLETLAAGQQLSLGMINATGEEPVALTFNLECPTRPESIEIFVGPMNPWQVDRDYRDNFILLKLD